MNDYKQNPENSEPDSLEGLSSEIERLQDEHNRLLAEKEAAYARLEDDLYLARKQARTYKDELEEVQKSRAYSLALKMRDLRLLIAPPNSPMEYLLGLSSRLVLPQDMILTSKHDPAQLAVLKERHRQTARNKLTEFLNRKDKFHLRQAQQPELTILLVLYNQAELTYACLRSLTSELGNRAEVLIVDNQSTDETAELLEKIAGVRILRNTENVGFIHAVNQGVAEAHGKFVLLLNNDTQVRPGSIDCALALIRQSDDIGAVGAKVLLLDGFLQEAGSLVWNNGVCLGFARGRHPLYDEVMFRRDVDFCSGVFLLTRRELFLQLGGFDSRFAPAYYEDVDYCMRLWQLGYRVVYDPEIIIDHYEYGSAGISDQALAQMQKNREIFAEKHQAALASHWPQAYSNILFARSPNNYRGRILFVDDLVPLPYHGAGMPRSRLMLQILHKLDYFITIFPMLFSKDSWEDVYKYMPREMEVMLNHGAERFEEFLKTRQGYYDILFISRPYNAQVIGRIFRERPELFKGLMIVYDAEAIWAMRDVERANSVGKALSADQIDRLIAKETAYADFADRISVVNEHEAAYFRKTFTKDIRILSHAVDTQPTQECHAERRDFLFVGRMIEDNAPNVDSMVWFTREILPRIQDQIGLPAKIHMIGVIQAPRIERLAANPSVNLVGPVDDLTDWYSRTRVFVAPTRFAAGIPLKVIEAVSYGIPCVITPLLARQLGWKPDSGALVGDGAEAFARQCASLYTDAELWERIRQAGLQVIHERHSFETFKTEIGRIIEPLPRR